MGGVGRHSAVPPKTPPPPGVRTQQPCLHHGGMPLVPHWRWCPQPSLTPAAHLHRYCGVQALATLKDAPSLHTLDLDLSSHRITDNGARALAALKGAPGLDTLRLNLSGNLVSDTGAELLTAMLQESPSIKCMSLDLTGDQPGGPTPATPPTVAQQICTAFAQLLCRFVSF